MKKNLILIGMPGCGKSTVGVVLAKMMGMDFLDLDLLIQSRSGKKLQVLLDEMGCDAFLDYEAEVCASVQCENTVIAPGGSAVLTERGASALKALGTMVYLKIAPEQLKDRLSNLATRGVAMQPGQTIEELYLERVAHYERWADHTVETGPSIEQMALRIMELCQTEGCV